MRIDLLRDSSNKFPIIDNPHDVKEMRVWHCKYKSLQVIGECTNLVELIIASVPVDSLEFLSNLYGLKYLKILHLPKIHSLSALEKLQSLESLSLATLPTWDSRGKVVEVDSFKPITNLSSLKHLELFGIVSVKESLQIFEGMQNLLTARFSGYAKQEIESFFKSTNVKNEFNPKSSFER